MGKAIVSVSKELWTLISPQKGTYPEIVSNDIPSDSELLNLIYDPLWGRFVATISSPSIPDTLEGKKLPILNGPRFRKVEMLEGQPCDN